MENRRFKSNNNFVLSPMSGESILVPMSDNVASLENLLTLNETGTFIIEQLQESKSVGEIADAILDEFDETDRTKVVADIENFVTQFVKLGYFTEI